MLQAVAAGQLFVEHQRQRLYKRKQLKGEVTYDHEKPDANANGPVIQGHHTPDLSMYVIICTPLAWSKIGNTAAKS